MFVNVGDNHSVIDRVKLTYNYDEIDDNEVSVCINADSCTASHFAKQWDFIARFFLLNDCKD